MPTSSSSRRSGFTSSTARGSTCDPSCTSFARELNEETFRWEYIADTTTRYPVRLFHRGRRVPLLAPVPHRPPFFWRGRTGNHPSAGNGRAGTRHADPGAVRIAHLPVGRARRGADQLPARLPAGRRLGGSTAARWDTIIQRVIEFLRSIPTIPLWMGLAAALPAHWSAIKVYFGITLVLSIVGWTRTGAGGARQAAGAARGRTS